MSLIRAALEQSQAELHQQAEHCGRLHDCFIALHRVLGPQQLAAAFGHDDAHCRAFLAVGGTEEEHRAVTERLAAQPLVTTADTAMMLARVKVLLQQTQAVYLRAEKQDVAAKVSGFHTYVLSELGIDPDS